MALLYAKRHLVFCFFLHALNKFEGISIAVRSSRSTCIDVLSICDWHVFAAAAAAAAAVVGGRVGPAILAQAGLPPQTFDQGGGKDQPGWTTGFELKQKPPES